MKLVLSCSIAFAVVLAGCGKKQESKRRVEVQPEFELGDATVPNEKSLPFRGLYAINDALKARVIDREKGDFFLGRYLDSFEAFPSGLGILLGVRRNSGIVSEFQNGSPNGVNMALWFLAFSRLGEDFYLALDCVSEAAERKSQYAKITDDFRNDLDPFCRWPAIAAEDLKGAWKRLVHFDVPDSEWEHLRAHMDQLVADKAGPKTALTEFVLASLANPYFLLDR